MPCLKAAIWLYLPHPLCLPNSLLLLPTSSCSVFHPSLLPSACNRQVSDGFAVSLTCLATVVPARPIAGRRPIRGPV